MKRTFINNSIIEFALGLAVGQFVLLWIEQENFIYGIFTMIALVAFVLNGNRMYLDNTKRDEDDEDNES